MYQLIIIGGATAGLSAAIYAGRKKIKTIILTDKVGGQSLLTDNIENYPGFKSITGQELTQKMREQAEGVGVEIQEGQAVVKIEKAGAYFKVFTQKREEFETKTIIIATGKKPRTLNVAGEKEFTSKGVSFCSICDAPLFNGKDVVVVGGGNSGLEAAWDLTKYANKIYVLEFGPKIKGDELTQEKLKQTNKVEFIAEATVKEIKGGKFVEGLVYEDKKTNEQKELKVSGVFVNIGQIPGSDFTKGFLELNKWGEIIINPRTNETSVKGVYAAGDVTDVIFKQCIVAASEGAKAALGVYEYLEHVGDRDSNIKPK